MENWFGKDKVNFGSLSLSSIGSKVCPKVVQHPIWRLTQLTPNTAVITYGGEARVLLKDTPGSCLPQSICLKLVQFFAPWTGEGVSSGSCPSDVKSDKAESVCTASTIAIQRSW